MATLTAADLHGTWELVRFDIESPEGTLAPWGKGATGLLIYASTGHVSVAFNKDVERRPGQSEEKSIFDAHLLYSGTFRVEGATVRHYVLNASNPERIGKEMVRAVELRGGILTMTGPKESFGRGIVSWKRVG